MKYDLNWVKEKFDNQEKIKYIFFWGHRAQKDGSIGMGCLSPWWEQSFEKENLVFKSAEHFMMYQKAILFEDTEIAQQILSCRTPAEAKKLGRKVRKFEQVVWEKNRYEIVLEASVLKFGQNEDLKEYLLKTGDRILVEASPYDKIWGIGLTKDAPNVHDPYTWDGLNLLGFALMDARDILQDE